MLSLGLLFATIYPASAQKPIFGSLCSWWARCQSNSLSGCKQLFEVSRMGTDCLFGTCVEVFSFSQLGRVDVVVFHSKTSSWFVYEYQVDRKTLDNPSIFVRHSTSGNHFDVTSSFSERHFLSNHGVEKHNRTSSAHFESFPLPALSNFIPSVVATTNF